MRSETETAPASQLRLTLVWRLAAAAERHQRLSRALPARHAVRCKTVDADTDTDSTRQMQQPLCSRARSTSQRSWQTHWPNCRVIDYLAFRIRSFPSPTTADSSRAAQYSPSTPAALNQGGLHFEQATVSEHGLRLHPAHSQHRPRRCGKSAETVLLERPSETHSGRPAQSPCSSPRHRSVRELAAAARSRYLADRPAVRSRAL